MTDTVTSLITAGALGTIIAGIITLVRIAIGAERRRADDWRTAAQTSAAANAILNSHMEKLTGSVELLTAAQREMTAVLQKIVAAEPRNAA